MLCVAFSLAYDVFCHSNGNTVGSNRNSGNCCWYCCNGTELGSASVLEHCDIDTHTDIHIRHGQTRKEHCRPSRGCHRWI